MNNWVPALDVLQNSGQFPEIELDQQNRVWLGPLGINSSH
jgi:hypothetical protein